MEELIILHVGLQEVVQPALQEADQVVTVRYRSRIEGSGGNELPIIVLLVHRQGRPNLLQIALTARFSGRFPRLRENREQDGCENRDNGDDYQKLDESETKFPSHVLCAPIVRQQRRTDLDKPDARHSWLTWRPLALRGLALKEADQA